MPEFTSEQMSRIRQAVRFARRAVLVLGTADPLVFARAFISRGGIQAPGEPLDAESRRRIESLILLGLQARRVPHHGHGAVVRSVVEREWHRATEETYLLSCMMVADPVAYRLVAPSPKDGEAGCEQFARVDAYGLGPGLIPVDKIVVPPPCCDGYTYQVLPASRPQSSVLSPGLR